MFFVNNAVKKVEYNSYALNRYMKGDVKMIFSDIFFLILHICGAGSFPQPLDPEEEERLVIAANNGDQSARSKLIEHNLRLVAYVVKKFGATQDEQDDLISIGTIGLIKAIDSYRPDKKTKLATYSARCIENEILMYYRSKKKNRNDVSINDEIDTDKDGNTLSLIDVLASDEDILDNIYRDIRTEKLIKAINTVLDPRERTIIELRYGLKEPRLTQKQTSEKLGISRSYVSRLEKKALKSLKKAVDT